MAVSLRGAGTSSSGTTSATPDWVAGAVGDPIVALIGHKPYSSSADPADVAFSQVIAATSGTVANGNGVGSTRATGLVKTADSAGTGSATFNVTSGSPVLGKTFRFATDTGAYSTSGLALQDTNNAVTTVSATGTATAGQFAAGDMVAICVALSDDAITNTSQSLSIPGCTVGTITWLSLATTTGNDANVYWGTCSITAGSSTASTVTYSASSGIGVSSAAAVLVRIREAAATTNAPPPDMRDGRIRRNSLLRR